MIKFILTTALVALTQLPMNEKTVYVCQNGVTEVYHVDKECKGLMKCTHEVKTIILEKAKEYKLRLCGWED